MQLYARDENGNRVFADCAERGVSYYCFECSGPLRLRAGDLRRSHFYHLQDERSPSCLQHSKSLLHIAIQEKIRTMINGSVDLEVAFPQIGRIADVAWYDKKVVFEVQISPISRQEVESRILDYRSIGWQVIWILHMKNFGGLYASSAELFLLDHPHYFADRLDDDVDIFDLPSAIYKGKRYLYGRQERVGFSDIELDGVDRSRSVFSRLMQRRVSQWPVCIRGDLLSMAAEEERNIEVWERRFYPPRKGALTRFVQRVVRALKFIEVIIFESVAK